MINYVAEDLDFPEFFDQDRLNNWLTSLAKSYNSHILGITYIFCSDEYLLGINKKFLDHDYYTDIITFPYREGRLLQSDIYISLDRVRDNAVSLGVSYESECIRVMAHGLLHLIGFKDKDEADAVMMRQEEEKAIILYDSVNNV